MLAPEGGEGVAAAAEEAGEVATTLLCDEVWRRHPDERHRYSRWRALEWWRLLDDDEEAYSTVGRVGW